MSKNGTEKVEIVFVFIVVVVVIDDNPKNLPLKFGQNLVSNIKDVIDVVVNVVIFVVVVNVFWSKFGKKQWGQVVRGGGGGVCAMPFSCQAQLILC